MGLSYPTREKRKIGQKSKSGKIFKVGHHLPGRVTHGAVSALQ
jgi:hypothetical protein